MHRVRRPSILVVESDCDRIRSACVDQDWVPFTAKAYGAAIEILGKHRWQGAVVQVPLGEESCEALRRRLTQNSIPYVVFTHEAVGYAAFIEGRPVYAPLSAEHIVHLLRDIMIAAARH
jgi:hypothetical protein